MYWLDIAILAVVILATLLGVRTGFVGQVARLLALGVALFGAVRLNAWATPLLERSVFQEAVFADAPAWLPRATAYAAVFLAIYVVLLSITLLLERGVRAAQVQWLNRTLGAGLGALKAGLILGILFLAAAAYAPDLSQEPLDKSSLAPHLSGGVKRLFEAVPEEYRESLLAQLRATVGKDE
jgi:uncharacterized membrane protein required for colicin V production